MELRQLELDFAVCKLASTNSLDLSQEFMFLSLTDDEVSLVCEVSHVPKNATDVEVGWRGLKIEGILDFSLIGIIAKISGLLAEQEISVFVISTFNTDYILIKDALYEGAVDVLRTNGYDIV